MPGFNGLDTVCKDFFQNVSDDGSEHEPEHPSLDALAFANNDRVQRSRPVGQTRKCVGMARPPHTLESVVFITTQSGSDQS